MKKVLIISTSIRAGSNSEILANKFYDGAKDGGHNVELITLRNKNVSFCRGCMACQKIGKCIQNDDANEITDKICESDVIVWVTPIYYYEMSGQMKTMIDRANSLYTRDYKFREVYLLTVAADDDPKTPEHAIGGIKGWIDCFEGVSLKGTLFLGGINDPNQIKNDERLEEAYKMGKNI